LEGCTPEEIADNLPTLSLEEIHASITYYLGHQAEMDAYLRRLDSWREQRYQQWAASPSPLAERLRALKRRERDTAMAS
jgi:hypothetical protein